MGKFLHKLGQDFSGHTVVPRFISELLLYITYTLYLLTGATYSADSESRGQLRSIRSYYRGWGCQFDIFVKLGCQFDIFVKLGCQFDYIIGSASEADNI